MKTISNKFLRGASVALIAFSSLGFAQDQPQANPGGWRKFGDAPADKSNAIEVRLPDAEPQGAQPPEPRGDDRPDTQRTQTVPPRLTLRQSA